MTTIVFSFLLFIGNTHALPPLNPKGLGLFWYRCQNALWKKESREHLDRTYSPKDFSEKFLKYDLARASLPNFFSLHEKQILHFYNRLNTLPLQWQIKWSSYRLGEENRSYYTWESSFKIDRLKISLYRKDFVRYEIYQNQAYPNQSTGLSVLVDFNQTMDDRFLNILTKLVAQRWNLSARFVNGVYHLDVAQHPFEPVDVLFEFLDILQKIKQDKSTHPYR